MLFTMRVACVCVLALMAVIIGAKHASEPVLLPIVKPFNCSGSVPPPATNVTRLQPGNIKVIMALGDSITAGFAMMGEFPTDALEYRDHVYSIGGNPKASTLPNFFKHYNPHLVGAAESVTIPMTKGDWLDAAVSMAKIEGVPSQVDYLVDAMTKGKYKDLVDYENDWKLLTLLIGANNLCVSCKPNRQDATPQFFETQLRSILNQIETSIPRVFVNVMTIFNISGVFHAGETDEYCRILWSGITNGECGCLTSSNNTDRLLMDEHAVAYNEVIHKVAAEFDAQSTGSSTFHVSVQPGVQDMNITYWGEHFLSDLDCFHPSLYANQFMALQLWNNMFQAPGHKSTSPTLNNMQYNCPPDGAFLQ